jgi:hypothetical protein
LLPKTEKRWPMLHILVQRRYECPVRGVYESHC